ncbi:unnamed protein product [Coccothraustes coccothraustes]
MRVPARARGGCVPNGRRRRARTHAPAPCCPALRAPLAPGPCRPPHPGKGRSPKEGGRPEGFPGMCVLVRPHLRAPAGQGQTRRNQRVRAWLPEVSRSLVRGAARPG